MIKTILARDKTSRQLLAAGWFYAFISFSFLKIVKIHLDGTRHLFCKVGAGFSVEHELTIVENPSQLNTAIEAARRYEDFILIEEKVEGREFSVGILGGQPLPAIEIKPLSGFYDYKNKYQEGLTEEICPAEISPELEALLEREAKTVHDTSRLGYYSRVDFIVDKENRAYCLEANTLPGMTPTSLLPQEALAVGISYPALCDKIVTGE